MSSPRLRRVGLVGAGIGLLIPLATNLTLETWFVWELTPEAIAQRMLLAPLGWLMARSLAVVWVESQRLSVLGAIALCVDLLDLRPLAPSLPRVCGMRCSVPVYSAWCSSGSAMRTLRRASRS